MSDRIEAFAAEYLAAVQRVLASLHPAQIAEVVEIVRQARDSGNRIYAVGNGGSASNASHFVNDMGKGASVGREKRFKVIPLADNVEWMTALSNDLCYEDVFVEQLRNFAEPGDVLIAISGSGNSENVLRAVRYANEVGCLTVGLTGFGGGKLKDLAQRSIVVDSDHMGQVEDMHLILLHIVCYYFMDQENFEQMPLTAEQLGDILNYLKEGQSVEVSSYKGEVVDVEMPITVELGVTETEPGFKGDTATGGSKLAKLETGFTIQVPLFINQGDVIKVDTRTGTYLERSS